MKTTSQIIAEWGGDRSEVAAATFAENAMAAHSQTQGAQQGASQPVAMTFDAAPSFNRGLQLSHCGHPRQHLADPAKPDDADIIRQQVLAAVAKMPLEEIQDVPGIPLLPFNLDDEPQVEEAREALAEAAEKHRAWAQPLMDRFSPAPAKRMMDELNERFYATTDPKELAAINGEIGLLLADMKQDSRGVRERRRNINLRVHQQWIENVAPLAKRYFAVAAARARTYLEIAAFVEGAFARVHNMRPQKSELWQRAVAQFRQVCGDPVHKVCCSFPADMGITSDFGVKPRGRVEEVRARAAEREAERNMSDEEYLQRKIKEMEAKKAEMEAKIQAAKN